MLNRSKLLDSAFMALFDFEPTNYIFELKYSAKFKDYNANVKYLGRKYTFSLSSEWKDVSSDIVVGVIQHLMLKAFSDSLQVKYKITLNIELYNNFLKNIHKYSAKTKVDFRLKKVFDRVNEKYFLGLIETPNLEWGSFSNRTLGHYSYGSDTITISRIFENISEDESPLLDFVMYHEMLHKKHKFTSSSGGRNLHHSSAFRKDEKKFENYIEVDKKLNRFVSSVRGPVKKIIRKKKKGFLDSWF